MTTKKPTLEERASIAFKKEYPNLDLHDKRSGSDTCIDFLFFKTGYFAAVKAGKPAGVLLDEKIKEIRNEVRNVVCCPMHLAELMAKIRKILETPEKEKRRPWI